MARPTIYTRVYSSSSAGRLVSAKGAQCNPLSEIALLEEFRNHADSKNREPTALVSCSDRMVDTLKRAFTKHIRDDESPSNIRIAFIEAVPTMHANATRVHSARELARQCQLLDSDKFLHEFVFEHAIPEECLLHDVSLHTLIMRGLQVNDFSQENTRGLRHDLAIKIQESDPWEIGLMLGCFARTFGARAPIDWISWQIFYDCVRAEILADDVVELCYIHGHVERVDFPFFCNLEDGMKTSLYDWWLADYDFYLDYDEFRTWRDEAEDSMNEAMIDCWTAWHDFGRDGIQKALSPTDELSYHRERSKLLVKHESKRQEIEAEAIKIGL